MSDIKSTESIKEIENPSLDLYEACKSFMVDHINGLKIDNLPVGERIYRIEHSIRVAKYAKMIAELEGLM